MQPGVRRFLPAVVFVLVGGLAVWVASPETLTGSADGAGCAGAPAPVEVQTEAMDQEDPAAVDAVAALINLPDAAWRQGGDQLAAARSKVADLGGENTLPTLVKTMQSQGIDCAACCTIGELTAGALTQATHDPELVEAANQVALNNLAQASDDVGNTVPVPGFPQLVDLAAGGLSPEQIDQGFGDLFDDMNGVEAINNADLECAVAHSLWILRYTRATMSEQAAADVNNRALDLVTNLEATSAVGVPLLLDLAGALPQTPEYGQRLLDLALQDDRLDASRAIACEGARVRGVDMTPLFNKDVNDFDPDAARCAIRAALDASHIDFAERTTGHGDPTARVAGWHALAEIGTSEHVVDAIDTALNQEGEQDYEPSIRERVAALDAVLAIGKRHPDAQPRIEQRLAEVTVDDVLQTWVDRIQVGLEGVE